MEKFYDKVSASADYIRQHAPLAPTVGIILGSGLGGLVDAMTDKTVIPYGDIPHFPHSTVAGHAGNLVIRRRRCRGVSTTMRALPCGKSPIPSTRWRCWA